jgi:hypothetical protein
MNPNVVIITDQFGTPVQNESRATLVQNEGKQNKIV